MPTLPTGTVTFLFTDIESSTRLWETDPESMRAALAHYDAACRRLLAMFRPERLHRVLRRRVPLFGGSAALDWILQGRIDQVVAEYERTLSYQA